MTAKRTARQKESLTVENAQPAGLQAVAVPPTQAEPSHLPSLLADNGGELSSPPLVDWEGALATRSNESANGSLGGQFAIQADVACHADEPSAWTQDILDRCCQKLRQHHRAYMRTALAGLQQAIAAGNFASVIKATVGHGQFKVVCQERVPEISFRRIEQYKWLAEHQDELLTLLRASNAQRAATMSNEELLASISIRRAQRMLTGDVSENSHKRSVKKRKRQSSQAHVVQDRDELQTPQSIVEAARQLLERSDLDLVAGDNPHLAAVLARSREQLAAFARAFGELAAIYQPLPKPTESIVPESAGG